MLLIVYATINGTIVKCKNVSVEFWKALNECLKELDEGRKAILMFNVRQRLVRELDIGVGKLGMLGKNEHGDSSLDMY